MDCSCRTFREGTNSYPAGIGFHLPTMLLSSRADNLI
jgi:hypothetical protein